MSRKGSTEQIEPTHSKLPWRCIYAVHVMLTARLPHSNKDPVLTPSDVSRWSLRGFLPQFKHMLLSCTGDLIAQRLSRTFLCFFSPHNACWDMLAWLKQWMTWLHIHSWHFEVPVIHQTLILHPVYMPMKISILASIFSNSLVQQMTILCRNSPLSCSGKALYQ